MLKFQTKHFLTGEELNRSELLGLLELSEELRNERKTLKNRTTLSGQNVTLLFEKPSLRTRVSFTVAMQELGGQVVEVISSVRKKEEPEDTAQVLAAYSHAVMCRTHEHAILERMASKSSVPIINGLSDSHHPCQALADILTLKQHFSKLEGLKVAYVGDGNNVLHSLLLLMPFLGVHLSYACPAGFEPNAFIVKNAKARALDGGGSITATHDPVKAVRDANALYTDVWVSMGFEDAEKESDQEKVFEPYQLNEELYSHAAPGAIVMHCMPMVRGKEISESMADHPCSVFFRQSENRLHAQKALLLGLLSSDS